MDETIKPIERTIPHKSYRELDENLVKYRFNQLGYYGGYSMEVVKDVAHAASFYFNGFDPSDSLIDIEADPFDLTINGVQFDTKEEFDANLEYHTNVQEFIRNIDFNTYTGETPLAKSVSILYANMEEEKQKQIGEAGEGEEQKMELFDQSKEQMLQRIKRTEKFINQVVEAATTTEAHTINPDEVSPEELIKNIKPVQLEALGRARIIKSRGKLESHKQSYSFEPSLMEEYSQVTSMWSLADRMMPTFNKNLATKSLLVKLPKEEKKQTLVMLIDNSGSMNSTDKVKWVKSLLYDRIDAVKSGNGVLYIAWFVESVDLRNVFKISNREEADAFVKKQFVGNFNGGGTNIEYAIKQIEECFDKGKLGDHDLDIYDPHILIVNDGQDTVNPNYRPKAKVHSFILGMDNKDLKQVVESTGGHYERFL